MKMLQYPGERFIRRLITNAFHGTWLQTISKCRLVTNAYLVCARIFGVPGGKYASVGSCGTANHLAMPVADAIHCRKLPNAEYLSAAHLQINQQTPPDAARKHTHTHSLLYLCLIHSPMRSSTSHKLGHTRNTHTTTSKRSE